MTTVNISEFRAHLVKYLQKANGGETISVTSHGRVLATVAAPEDARAKAREELESLAGTAWLGDVVSPIDDAWEADQ